MVKNFFRTLLVVCGLAQPGNAQTSPLQANVYQLPPAVGKLTLAVASIPGIASVNIDKTYLPDIELSDLSLPGAYGDLPAATLRRTGGALSGELLLSINFTISRDDQGLKALEFLSWWVRDQARSGNNLQLRALALPPIAGEQVQLGETLRFTIDWFYIGKSETIEELMTYIDDMSVSLEQSVEDTKSAF